MTVLEIILVSAFAVMIGAMLITTTISNKKIAKMIAKQEAEKKRKTL